ncbi:DNA-binding protein [Epilithonimonas vandammei]|uniref:DNA-binding protein n=1 Tax=Epilithonimonas vandammei TaxID=2487072 RepID=A0A3G8ZEF0_9FLAO|nr:helix-turn-helix domain-containing protein [Epilithonimonas vandammei]AZI55155.1 DNA-binding protein [Epilithonimonas vandammei]
METEKFSNAYFLKKIRALEKRIKILENFLEEKTLKETYTVEEVLETYGISRSTFDRYRKAGLKVSQPERNGKIMIKKTDIENYLKK